LKNVSSIKNFLLQKFQHKLTRSTEEIRECFLKTLKNIKIAEIFENHRSVAERQRCQYEKDKNNVRLGSIMILCDWKEKIKIGFDN